MIGFQGEAKSKRKISIISLFMSVEVLKFRQRIWEVEVLTRNY